MKFNGTVNLSHFGEFYNLLVKYDGVWEAAPDEVDGIVPFAISIYDEDAAAFKEEVCRLLPCVEFTEPTLWQKIKNFFNLKGDTCDQCC